MPLLKTVSGVRGTIGGIPSDSFSPPIILETLVAFTRILKKNNKHTLVVGRDGRKSGEMIQHFVMSSLRMLGIHVVDVGLTTTPTLAYAVFTNKDFAGGIIITASHNPENWNALKILNEYGEFFTDVDLKDLYNSINYNDKDFVDVENLGNITTLHSAIDHHLSAALNYSLVSLASIKKRKLKVVADVINSTGTMALKSLFENMHIDYTLLNAEKMGDFKHNPEPLPENLMTLSQEVVRQKADLGIAVDPDVDRLCFVDEYGAFFGEEYTIVAIADYFLQKKKGALVSNLSSSQALKDIAEKYNVEYFSSKVGEAHVVEKMKNVNAVFGGEGNGGVIVPDFHYGRDAIIGICLFLSYLCETNLSVSTLRKKIPNYAMIKDKIDISKISLRREELIAKIKSHYENNEVNEEDGIKIFIKKNTWVQIRFSNTEAIIRIIAEANTEEECLEYIDQVKRCIDA